MHPIFTAYLARLEALHADIVQALADLPPAALDWSPAAETNSIAVLVTHIAGSERFWIGEKAGGIPAGRDRASEFRVHSEDAAALCSLLEESLALARTVLAGLTPADLERSAGLYRDQPVDAAWALWHALEHAAIHVGHIQLTRAWWLATRA